MTPKAELRRQLRRRLRDMSREEKEAQSTTLRTRLLADPGLRGLQRIGIFLPLEDEPNLLPALAHLLEMGIDLAAPFPLDPLHWKFRHITELTLYQKQPETSDHAVTRSVIKPEHLQAILVPGRGFTPDGHRLGRGGGIYDRLLSHTLRGPR
jgi:5-formyltetrahydrofolate cyclo-ligase